MHRISQEIPMAFSNKHRVFSTMHTTYPVYLTTIHIQHSTSVRCTGHSVAYLLKAVSFP
ncbi:MAG TPA: hypothetical protein PKD83_13170 [Ignavibacteria bacterium]|nr:hypothetical protein [Ignavibacteria bacterium]